MSDPMSVDVLQGSTVLATWARDDLQWPTVINLRASDLIDGVLTYQLFAEMMAAELITGAPVAFNAKREFPVPLGSSRDFLSQNQLIKKFEGAYCAAQAWARWAPMALTLTKAQPVWMPYAPTPTPGKPPPKGAAQDRSHDGVPATPAVVLGAVGVVGGLFVALAYWASKREDRIVAIETAKVRNAAKLHAATAIAAQQIKAGQPVSGDLAKIFQDQGAGVESYRPITMAGAATVAGLALAGGLLASWFQNKRAAS